MNSPQHISAPQRRAKKELPPLLLPAREGGWGDEYMNGKSISQIINHS